MNKVGRQLRKAREAKRIELKEVERITKIDSKYLQAMEEGDYGALPEEVYAVGFLRSYTRFLDLDAKSLISDYRKEVSAIKLEPTHNRAAQDANRRQKKQSFLMKILHYFKIR